MYRYAINPARDLGPRVMISLLGWGGAAFTAHSHWWWIPVLACHLGGLLGVSIHWLLLEQRQKQPTETEETIINN